MPIITSGMRKWQRQLRLEQDQKRLEEVMKLKERMKETLESLIRENKVELYSSYLKMFAVYGAIDYNKIYLIGRGTFTKSYKFKNLQGETRIAKVIDLNRVKPEYRDKFLHRQCNILLFLRENQHEHIIRTYAICRVRHHIFIYSEYCSYGSLMAYRKSVRKKHFSAEESQKYAYQILSVIDFLHYYCIAHRNLNPDNILLIDANTIRVSGFGFSRFCYDVESNTFRKSATRREPEPFQAPEMIEGETTDPKQADLWSLGAVTYWLLTGDPPYDPKKMIAKGTKLTTFGYREYHCERVAGVASENANRLLERLLVSDPAKRFTSGEAKASAWIQEYAKTVESPTPSPMESPRKSGETMPPSHTAMSIPVSDVPSPMKSMPESVQSKKSNMESKGESMRKSASLAGSHRKSGICTTRSQTGSKKSLTVASPKSKTIDTLASPKSKAASHTSGLRASSKSKLSSDLTNLPASQSPNSPSLATSKSQPKLASQHSLETRKSKSSAPEMPQPESASILAKSKSKTETARRSSAKSIIRSLLNPFTSTASPSLTKSKVDAMASTPMATSNKSTMKSQQSSPAPKSLPQIAASPPSQPPASCNPSEMPDTNTIATPKSNVSLSGSKSRAKSLSIPDKSAPPENSQPPAQ